MGRQHTAVKAVMGKIQGAMGTSLLEPLNRSGGVREGFLEEMASKMCVRGGWLTTVPWARAACCLLYGTAHELRIVSTFLNVWKELKENNIL